MQENSFLSLGVPLLPSSVIPMDQSCKKRSIPMSVGLPSKRLSENRRIKNRESAQVWREKKRLEMLELAQENAQLKNERETLFKRLDEVEKSNLEMQKQLRELQNSLQILSSQHFDRENNNAFSDNKVWTERGLLGEARLGEVLLPPEQCTGLGKPKALVKKFPQTHANSPLGLPTLLVSRLEELGNISQQSRLVHSGRRLKVLCLVLPPQASRLNRPFLTLKLFLLICNG